MPETPKGIHEEIVRQSTVANIPASAMNPVIDVIEVENVRTALLAWAGFHRGKGIHEDAMPRFHELIDRLDKALGHF